MKRAVCECCGQPIPDKPSDEAIGYFFHVRDKIATEQGEDREMVRYDLQFAFGVRIKWADIMAGYIPKFEGKWIEYKGVTVFFKTLGKYTKDEVDCLTQGAKVQAAELGIEL